MSKGKYRFDSILGKVSGENLRKPTNGDTGLKRHRSPLYVVVEIEYLTVLRQM